MDHILLAPPLAFLIILGLSLLLSRLCDEFAVPGLASPGKTRPYACGEDTFANKVYPDYGEFFPFAFFFTIMHVVALIVATVPAGIYGMPLLYLFVAVLALLILFRR